MRVVFIGTGEIGVPTLHALLGSEEHQLAAVVTQPDKPVGREQRIEPSPIKKALAGTKIPILQPARIKDRQSIEEISARSPQAIIVMAYGQILPRGILETPRVACLNLHASLLPRHRGAAPIQAAIASGDPETGITVMYMDEGLDTGDILLQRKIDILPTETGGSLHDRLGQIAPDALLESLQLLAKEIAPRIPQNNALATYASKLNRNDGKIDWSQPADILERKIRAFNPWPGAFTTVTAKSGKPRNLKIFSASIVDLVGEAGEILQTGKRGLVIAASDRALSLEEVQPEGKRRMTSAEFLHGFEAASASWG
ncbi:MAG: methionyl-tRNA formyltransferase [Verrucomicrobia bacterium]|nr:MAG: methionyl-tRNA formyltransferase [Verrucomicrobiota bacterium]